MKGMMRSKGGKVAVRYFPKQKQLDLTAPSKSIPNYKSLYSGKTYERIVVPENWTENQIKLGVAKEEFKEDLRENPNPLGVIDYFLFKRRVKKVEKFEQKYRSGIGMT